MLFSSLLFLFAFLPLVLLVYYAVPKKRFGNGILLAFSLLFYAWGGISYAVILVASITVNHVLAVQIQNREKRKTWFVIGLSFNVALLLVFKYFGFFAENLQAAGLLGESRIIPKIALPLGISFYTFHQMSMLWDRYRSEIRVPLKWHETALYVSFFPQLIAGPIVRYHDIIDQIRGRKETLALFASGIRRFSLGFFKKVVLANTCAGLADGVFNQPLSEASPSAAWLALVAYALQIYFDFAGYSDMAIGLARMFGFRILENFNLPYCATSIRDFWHRWHISLSTWFRDYLYIPLGGSRKGTARTYLNLFIVFFCTGFWHGASWSFVVWGLIHGLFLILERTFAGKISFRIPPIISRVYVWVVVLFAWVFFRIEDFTEAGRFIALLFGEQTAKAHTAFFYLDNFKLGVLCLALVSALGFFEWLRRRLERVTSFGTVRALGENMLVLFFLLSGVLLLNAGSYNPFIYFRF